MTTKTRRPYGKPPKLTASVKRRLSPTQFLVVQVIPVRRTLPDGGIRVQMEPVERTMDIREIRESDRKLVQVGDRISLPSKRGPRQWGRAMTPKRKRRPRRFTFTFSSMEVRRVES